MIINSTALAKQQFNKTIKLLVKAERSRRERSRERKVQKQKIKLEIKKVVDSFKKPLGRLNWYFNTKSKMEYHLKASGEKCITVKMYHDRLVAHILASSLYHLISLLMSIH